MHNHLSRRTFLRSCAATTAMMGMSSSHLLATERPLFFDRTSRKIGLQLYTLGDLTGDNLESILAQVAAIGYQEIELPGLYGYMAADIKKAADRAGLVISGLHLAATPNLGHDQLTIHSDAYRIGDSLGELGVSQVVVPMAPFPPRFKPSGGSKGDFLNALAHSYAEAGEDIWKQTAALLNERAETLKPLGISLGYHNHNIEFAPIGATSAWEILVQETDSNLIKFEIDTGWLGAAGIDPAKFLLKHSGRVRWIHVKDIQPTTATNYALSMEPAEVGSGELNWPHILSAAAAAGVEHFYVEQEPPFALPRIESVARSYQYLSTLPVESA